MRRVDRNKTKIVDLQDESAPQKQIIGYKPHAGQRRIHNAINNTDDKYYVIANGRQWGKTFMCINQLCYWGINDHDSNIYYVAPTLKLSRIVFYKLYNVLATTGLLKKVDKTNLVLEFVTGSIISFHTADSNSGNAMRGATLSHLVMDECAFMNESVWNEVLKPATFVKGKKVIFISTPAGRNWFYELWMKGQSGVKRYQSFTAPTAENPAIPREELEEMKRENELAYRVECLAEFLEDKLTVFQNVSDCTYSGDITANVPDKKDQYVMGIDLANTYDYTVAFVMDQNKKIVDMYRVNFTNPEFVKQGIADLYHKWQPIYGHVESNFNPSFVADLQVNYNCSRLRPVQTTPANKPVMINELVSAFQTKSIRIPDNKIIKGELDTYTYKYNKSTGKIVYNARSGFHDDCVMALSFTLAAFKEKNPIRRKFRWTVI